jgi:Flp pilus assembly protein TadG
MAALKRLAAARRDQSGAELIEFAVVFPILLLTMLGMFDFGLLFERYQVVTNAAREGARVAVLPGYSDADVEARVNQYLTAGGLTDTPTITVGGTETIRIGPECISVRPVTVAYPHPFSFVGTFMTALGSSGFTSTTVQATASMRNEVPASSCP